MTTASEPSYRRRIGYQAGLLGGFCMAAGILLTLADRATRDAIEARQREARLATLETIVPTAPPVTGAGSRPEWIRGRFADRSVAWLEATGSVSAIAFDTVGAGYAGPIRLLLAVTPEGTLLGVRVLTHTETPGLGDQIEAARSDWIHRFAGRALGDPPQARWTVRADGGAFDALTGATVSSRAVVEAVAAGLGWYRRHAAGLQALAPNSTASSTPPAGENRP